MPANSLVAQPSARTQQEQGSKQASFPTLLYCLATIPPYSADLGPPGPKPHLLTTDGNPFYLNSHLSSSIQECHGHING